MWPLLLSEFLLEIRWLSLFINVYAYLKSSTKSWFFLCSCSIMEMEEEYTRKPNWLELPKDITMNILQRLDTLEIVTSASVVCPRWWKICKDPLMWRTIDMMTNISLSYSDFDYCSRLQKICSYAVDRSCGHLKDISIMRFGTNDLLRHIANR